MCPFYQTSRIREFHGISDRTEAAEGDVIDRNQRQGSVQTDRRFEMKNEEFKAKETKYQALPNFRICCSELRGLQVASFRACVHSFCSVRISR